MLKRLACISLLAVGCTHAPPTAEELARQFTVHNAAFAYTVSATASSLSGPDYDVAVFPGGMRGTVAGRTLDLQLKTDQVTGMFGPSQVSLHLVPGSEGTRVRGLYSGAISDVVVTPQRIHGQAGNCVYDLVFVGTMYSGWSDCLPSGKLQTTVKLPTGYADHPDLLKATELVIMLGHVADRPTTAEEPLPRGDPNTRPKQWNQPVKVMSDPAKQS